MEEAEPQDLVVGSLITGIEDFKVVKEIRPKFLKGSGCCRVVLAETHL